MSLPALLVPRLGDPQQLELAVQRRALHPDEARGARDVAREAADLDAEIFALEGLAGFLERGAYDRVGADAVAHLAGLAEDLGGQQVEVDPPDPVAGGKNHGALDDVAKLADIARPFIALERDHRVGGDLGSRHAALQSYE